MSASRPARYGASSAARAGSTSSSLSSVLSARYAFAPPGVSQFDGLDGALAREVAGEGPRAPALEAEVDGVGAGGKGRAQGARLSGRRQQLYGGSGWWAHASMVHRAAAGAAGSLARRMSLHGTYAATYATAYVPEHDIYRAARRRHARPAAGGPRPAAGGPRPPAPHTPGLRRGLPA